MKKISLICAWTLVMFVSCTKDDLTGIPPIDGIEESQPTTSEAVNASEIDDTFYQTNKNKKVTIKGEIVVKGTSAYFELKDKTLIQIFAHKKTFDPLSKDAKNKLKINGQELSVTGTLTDFKNKQGTIIKEIVYEKESDLIFGQTPQQPVNNVIQVNASEIDEAFYQQHQTAKSTIKLKGIVVVKTIKNKKYTYVILGDNTEIQVFSHNAKNFKPEVIQKLQTNGQEITITGVFKDYTIKSGTIKQIVYQTENDLLFGTQATNPTPPTQIEEVDATQSDSSVYVEGKKVKLIGTISVENKKSYIVLNDGTRIQLYSKDFPKFKKEIKNKLSTQGQKVAVVGTFKNYTKNGVTTKQILYTSENDVTFY